MNQGNFTPSRHPDHIGDSLDDIRASGRVTSDVIVTSGHVGGARSVDRDEGSSNVDEEGGNVSDDRTRQ